MDLHPLKNSDVITERAWYWIVDYSWRDPDGQFETLQELGRDLHFKVERLASLAWDAWDELDPSCEIAPDLAQALRDLGYPVKPQITGENDGV